MLLRSLCGLLVVAGTFSIASYGEEVDHRNLIEKYQGNLKWLQEVFPDHEKLGIDWLKSLINKNQVKSVEELLPLLPLSLRKNYTLIHTTNSLQDASKLNPRAILFSPDARLVVAFNGASHQRRFQQLEVLDFTAEDGSARFFEIDFRAEGDQTFSDPNPAACLKCHSASPVAQTEAKPIWNRYSDWHGTYGTNDDRLGKNEADAYKAFLSAAESHPRYKWLERDSQYQQSAPYYSHLDLTGTNESSEKNSKTSYQDNGQRIRYRNVMFMPNLRLSKALDARNAVRVAKKITRTDLFKKFPHATLFSMICESKAIRHNKMGNNDVELLPEPEKLPDFKLTDFGIHENEVTILFSSWATDYTNGNISFDTKDLMAGTILNHLPADTSLAFYQRHPEFWGGYYSQFEFSSDAEVSITDTYKYSWSWAYLMDQLTPSVSALTFRAYNQTYSKLGQDLRGGLEVPDFCAELSKEALAEVKASKAGELDFAMRESRTDFLDDLYGYGRSRRTERIVASRDVETLTNQCASCHSDPISAHGETIAPWIPFANPHELADVLAGEERGSRNRLIEKVKYYTSEEMKGAHEGGKRMPLGKMPLNAKESEELIGYLEGLRP